MSPGIIVTAVRSTKAAISKVKKLVKEGWKDGKPRGYVTIYAQVISGVADLSHLYAPQASAETKVKAGRLRRCALALGRYVDAANGIFGVTAPRPSC